MEKEVRDKLGKRRKEYDKERWCACEGQGRVREGEGKTEIAAFWGR